MAKQAMNTAKEELTSNYMNGSRSKLVQKIPVLLLHQIRPRILSLLKITWPYIYDNTSDIIRIDNEDIPLKENEIEFSKLFFSMGSCMDSPGAPIITYRFRKKTSQGKVVLAKIIVND